MQPSVIPFLEQKTQYQETLACWHSSGQSLKWKDVRLSVCAGEAKDLRFCYDPSTLAREKKGRSYSV